MIHTPEVISRDRQEARPGKAACLRPVQPGLECRNRGQLEPRNLQVRDDQDMGLVQLPKKDLEGEPYSGQTPVLRLVSKAFRFGFHLLALPDRDRETHPKSGQHAGGLCV